MGTPGFGLGCRESRGGASPVPSELPSEGAGEKAGAANPAVLLCRVPFPYGTAVRPLPARKPTKPVGEEPNLERLPSPNSFPALMRSGLCPGE